MTPLASPRRAPVTFWAGGVLSGGFVCTAPPAWCLFENPRNKVVSYTGSCVLRVHHHQTADRTLHLHRFSRARGLEPWKLEACSDPRMAWVGYIRTRRPCRPSGPVLTSSLAQLRWPQRLHTTAAAAAARFYHICGSIGRFATSFLRPMTSTTSGRLRGASYGAAGRRLLPSLENHRLPQFQAARPTPTPQ